MQQIIQQQIIIIIIIIINQVEEIHYKNVKKTKALNNGEAGK